MARTLDEETMASLARDVLKHKSAFPWVIEHIGHLVADIGMSQRTFIAMHMMAAHVSSDDAAHSTDNTILAEAAVQRADALIAALERAE